MSVRAAKDGGEVFVFFGFWFWFLVLVFWFWFLDVFVFGSLFLCGPRLAPASVESGCPLVSNPVIICAGDTLAVRCRLVHVGPCGKGWRRSLCFFWFFGFGFGMF
jgi:hypothetical protein